MGGKGSKKAKTPAPASAASKSTPKKQQLTKPPVVAEVSSANTTTKQTNVSAKQQEKNQPVRNQTVAVASKLKAKASPVLTEQTELKHKSTQPPMMFVPSGHTAFTWESPSGTLPCGHTNYSWGIVA